MKNHILLEELEIAGAKGRAIIVDNFAGGGGASIGIALSTGSPVDVAINHDPIAIAMHRMNHPGTVHYCENVWDVDPREVVRRMGGRPVALCWLSPDCKHFSKAKGGKPVDKNIRSLAWVAVRWAATVRPRMIILENVEEFKTWGPLVGDRPDPKQKGRTFNAFVNALKRYGYRVEWEELRACDYGAPTIRKRLFLVARCDGRPIVWPEPSHGNPESEAVRSGRLMPWRTAAEIIDWSLPCPSIFERKKPLAENTMRRIARGIQKFVVENPKPFIVKVNHGRDDFRGQEIDRPLSTITAKHGYGLVATFLSKYHGEKHPADSRGQVPGEPIRTVDTANRFSLVTSHLIKLRGTCQHGAPVDQPAPTITAGGLHVGEVRAFLQKYIKPEGKDRRNNSSKENGSAGRVGDTAKRGNLEDCSQGQPGANTAHCTKEGRVPTQQRLFGNCSMGEREAISYPCSPGSLDDSCGRNSDGDGPEPQERGQTQQPSREPGSGDARREPSACVLNGIKDGYKLSGRLFGASEESQGERPILLKNSGSLGDFSDNSVQGCAAFVTKFYGSSVGHTATEPLHTVTTRDRFGLVTVHGQDYQIVDIGMRMLEPHELFAAQGFPATYVIDRDIEGNRFSKATQVALCGNSVPPVLAKALVKSNLPEMCRDWPPNMHGNVIIEKAVGNR